MSDKNEIDLTKVDLSNLTVVWERFGLLVKYLAGDVKLSTDGTLQAQIDNKADKPTMKTLTIPATGWKASAVGEYSYSLTLNVSGITAQDIVNGSISLDTEEIAQDCNLSTINQSGAGTLTFYAQTVPTATMTYNYYILKGV